ncbi:MAG: hypothetical protein CMH61_01190 [Nanoarchaeota archaeon]|nr:hypothetical protein [Nanoarchaeota archaeon]|tara:strand:- start:4701 stop:5009 length:309 start_codon:yes stop_codon:yes gene_type:complete
MAVVYPLKLKEEIMPIIELKSKEDHTNKSIVLKQMIYQSLEDYVVRLCSRGRLSVGKAAEVLDMSVYDIHRVAREKGLSLTASDEQRAKSRNVLDKLVKKKS